MKNLTDIAARISVTNFTDKNEHGYMPFYEENLPATVNKFLEIGVWKGGGILSFKEWYDNQGEFHVVNHRYDGEIIRKQQLKKLGIIPHEGSQSDLDFLNTLPTDFDVISEDGSHHSDEQCITFNHMFQHNVKRGGLYVCEDLHCCKDPYWWRNICQGFSNTLLAVIQQYQRGEGFTSQFFTQHDSMALCALIADVKMYNEQIVFIRKK